jgi:hypothetical protein
MQGRIYNRNSSKVTTLKNLQGLQGDIPHLGAKAVEALSGMKNRQHPFCSYPKRTVDGKLQALLVGIYIP